MLYLDIDAVDRKEVQVMMFEGVIVVSLPIAISPRSTKSRAGTAELTWNHKWVVRIPDRWTATGSGRQKIRHDINVPLHD